MRRCDSFSRRAIACMDVPCLISSNQIQPNAIFRRSVWSITGAALSSTSLASIPRRRRVKGTSTESDAGSIRAGEVALAAPGDQSIRLLLDLSHAADLQIDTKQAADSFGLQLVDYQCSVLGLIAEWRHAAHPQALALGSGDLGQKRAAH